MLLQPYKFETICSIQTSSSPFQVSLNVPFGSVCHNKQCIVVHKSKRKIENISQIIRTFLVTVRKTLGFNHWKIPFFFFDCSILKKIFPKWSHTTQYLFIFHLKYCLKTGHNWKSSLLDRFGILCTHKKKLYKILAHIRTEYYLPHK